MHPEGGDHARPKPGEAVSSDAPIDPPATRPWHRRRWAKTAVRVGLGLVATLFALWAVLYITKGRFLKGPFETIATAQAGRDVTVAGDFQFYFDPIDLKFMAEGLRVANPDWRKGDFFKAELIDTRTATLSFVWGPRRINWIELRGAEADLAWDAGHQRNNWTFGDPEAKGEPLDLPLIKRARMAGTVVRYADPRLALSGRVGLRTVEASDNRFGDAIRFDGEGTARTTNFTLSGSLLSPNDAIGGGRTALGLVIEAVDSRAEISGTLSAPTVLDGADLRLTMSGSNLANVFRVAGIAVPDTRDYKLSSALTKAGPDWKFTGLKGTFGDSDIAGKLTVTMRQPRLLLTATLATRTLDIVDVAPFIGYNPDLIAAKGSAGAITRVGGTPRMLPDAKLRVDSLKNFDADVHYTVQQLRARSLPVSHIDLTLKLDDRLLTLSPLSFAMSRGTLDSDIVINARKSPVFTDYDIRLSPTPMSVLLAGWGVEESGTTGTVKARVKLTGSGDSVHTSLSHANGRIAVILPAGKMWARNIQLSELDIGTFIQKMFEGKLKEPVEINCGLIGFSVRDGIAAADPILIDTKKNVMVGRGGFSFRNESIDLAFRADSKKFSVFAGQSPVGVKGYFAEPGINAISPELLGRAGAGLGLALVATPVAGVLAFVDVGDAKSTACGPVLSGATATAQRTTKGQARDDVGKGTTATSEDGKQSSSDRKKQRKKFLGIF